MKEYRKVQSEKGRKPELAPDPAVVTRWNSYIDECERAQKIMGDMNLTLKRLIGAGGADYNASMGANEKNELTYTEEDVTVIRQFVGAAGPARVLTKFFQDNRNAYAYTLIETRIALQQSSADFFAITADVSHMDRSESCIFISVFTLALL
jgi:hypothetical protein